MTLHALRGALETPALQGIKDRQVLIRPGLDALKPAVPAVLYQSAQAVLLLDGLDQESVAAEAGDDLVKRGVEIVGPGTVNWPAAAELADELPVILAQQPHRIPINLEARQPHHCRLYDEPELVAR